MTQFKTTYKTAGVNIELGDFCSRVFYDAAKQTFANRFGRFGDPLALEGGFSGALFVDSFTGHLVKNSDGVGTKAEIAQRMNIHNTLAFDLLAMVCDDAVCMGAEPFAAVNSLDMRAVHEPTVRALAEGMIAACEAAGIAMVGGETAELGSMISGYGEYPYVWNAEVTGAIGKGKLIDGSKITLGDTIVTLRSDGFRSNGFSLARKILSDAYGAEYHLERYGTSTWGDVLLTPSRIYTKTLLGMHGGYGEKACAPVHGVAHITGGGILSNLSRVLKGHGARLDAVFEPHAAMKQLIELGNVDISEAYRTWNMGNGMLIITPDPKAVCAVAHKHGIDSQIAGEVVDSGMSLIGYTGEEIHE